MKDERTRRLLRWLVIAFCIFAIIFLVLMVYYFPIKDRLPEGIENYSGKILISYSNEVNNMTQSNLSQEFCQQGECVK